MKILLLAEIGLCHFKQKSIQNITRPNLQKHSDLIRNKGKDPNAQRNEKELIMITPASEQARFAAS